MASVAASVNDVMVAGDALTTAAGASAVADKDAATAV